MTHTLFYLSQFPMSYLLLENVGFTRGLGERTPAGVIGSSRSCVVFMLLVVYIRGQQGTQRKFRLSHVRRSRVSWTFQKKMRFCLSESRGYIIQ